jgi:hypothetical protein
MTKKEEDDVTTTTTPTGSQQQQMKKVSHTNTFKRRERLAHLRGNHAKSLEPHSHPIPILHVP